jgi:hypothetical protein
MQRNEYPYEKFQVPIWINRDYEMIVILPISFENHTFSSKVMFSDKTVKDFTVTKTVNTVKPNVLLQLSLTELQTADLEPDTIAKFDIKYSHNTNTGTLMAGEIPVANSIT